jgi:hypothetical protein
MIAIRWVQGIGVRRHTATPNKSYVTACKANTKVNCEAVQHTRRLCKAFRRLSKIGTMTLGATKLNMDYIASQYPYHSAYYVYDKELSVVARYMLIHPA